MAAGSRLLGLVFALAAPALFGCAARAAQPAAPPPAVQEPAPLPVPVPIRASQPRAPLEPSDAALRTADRVALTGRELGTMWTFENPPREYWRERYGFDASTQWLEHVRLASVRYGDSCSASFVSPDGLAMTNHHCARECVEAQSAGATDHVERGFYAPSRERELVCPELYLDQLVAIHDISARISAAAPTGATPQQRRDAQQQASEAAEQECEQRTNLTCQVVSLYQGGQHQLYEYRRFAPVKLVFAPELQAGYFGGDPDNFTYPRHALDVSFVRAYDGETPASTPHHFRWREEGAAEGELVFVTGNPGSTSRLITVAQAMYEQQFRHPFLVQLLEGQRAVLQEIAKLGPEAERQVRQDLFSVENSLKAHAGQLAGLRDTLLMGRKIRWERELRERVRAHPSLQQRYGDLWDAMERIQTAKLRVSPRLNVVNEQFIGAPHLVYAGNLVTFIRASARSDAERPAELQQSAEQIEDMLRSPSPVDATIGLGLLALHLEMARRWLQPDDPLLRALLLPDETAQAAAERIARESRVLDPVFRSELLDGGLSVLDNATDPLILFAIVAEDAYPDLEQEWSRLTAEEDEQNARLAEVLFAAYGTGQPPDATFTLRISDGEVRGYPYNGTVAPPFTTLFGLYGRAAAFGNVMPFTLPAAFGEQRARVKLDTPLNMVSTNDITGGNSGSPVIDREARIVGVAFDGNIEQLPNQFLFRAEAGRTVSVHAAGIIEALRSVYGATALVDELLSTQGEPGDERTRPFLHR